MQTRIGTTALLALSALSALSAAQAQTQTQIHEFKDWAIACDNRRHCEAIAYQSEESGSAPVTMWLSRDAGPHARVHIQFDTDESEDTQSLTLHLGPRQQLKGISPRKDLSPADTAKLLAYVLEGEEIVVAEGGSGNSSKKRWQLSLAGSKAALLKMDDLQGRVGTPGALVRRGTQLPTKAESSVLQALAAPRIKAAALPKTAESDQALLQPILDAVTPRECWEDLPDDSNPEQSITRVSATEVLVMRECGRGAYQGGSGIWLAKSKPPYAPRRLLLPLTDGESTDYVMNSNLTAEGRLSSFAKGRGISDCGSSFDWVWNGRSFELIEAWRSPLCRGFPGGGFGLRVWTAQTAR